jgi:hypothetical protein
LICLRCRRNLRDSDRSEAEWRDPAEIIMRSLDFSRHGRPKLGLLK